MIICPIPGDHTQIFPADSQPGHRQTDPRGQVESGFGGESSPEVRGTGVRGTASGGASRSARKKTMLITAITVLTIPAIVPHFVQLNARFS
ncbi:hypothetical protein [Streptosporangium sp. NPDC006007]|uniref:hypothetical protein n=1 Tax=Streptosporangium sp. NPDC006007 TaxID=3154575 RepID=UPI0033A312E9